MPIKKSAIKALRQSKKKALTNKKVVSDIEALIRRVRKATAGNDRAKANDWLKQVIKKIDKAVQKRIIKKNTAARKKSRLSKAVKALVQKK